MAVGFLTLYGGQVSQSIAELPVGHLLAGLLISYAAVYGVRGLLEKPLVTSAGLLRQPRRQFLFDLVMSLVTGILVAAITMSGFGVHLFPTLSLVFGVTVYGLLIALDMSLARERSVIGEASEHSAPTGPPRGMRSKTKGLVLVAVAAAISCSGVIILVIAQDLAWLTRLESDSASMSRAVYGITTEILFIIAVLLGHGINLILSYSRNLRLLLRNETRVLEKVSRGDLSRFVPVVTHDEFGVSAGHINTMIEGLRHRITLMAALKLAEEVQRSLMPSEFPKIPGLDLSGTSIYCDETGGDYCDCLRLPGGRIGIVVADTCGHGIDAALFMTTARAFLIYGAKDYLSPARLLDEVNRCLCRDSGATGRFITLFFLEVEPAQRTLRWSRAGHDPALLFDPVNADFLELDGEGVALGADADFKAHEVSLTAVAPGTVVVIGTDGIWEARSSTGELFGKHRLMEVVRNCSASPAAVIQAAVIDSVHQFRAGAPPEDDLALMVVKLL
jgi:sigma-B regulation protein RsbU (phosphoserine phosphatase)